LNEPLIPFQTLDAELRQQLQTRLPEPLFDRLNASIDLAQQRRERLERENHLLRELRRLALLKKYGPGSEHLSDAQLELLEVEPGVNTAEVEAEACREPVAAAAKPGRPHPGRQTLPAHLPRVEKIIPCTPEQCLCGQSATKRASSWTSSRPSTLWW
jgi:transposase